MKPGAWFSLSLARLLSWHWSADFHGEPVSELSLRAALGSDRTCTPDQGAIGLQAWLGCLELICSASPGLPQGVCAQCQKSPELGKGTKRLHLGFTRAVTPCPTLLRMTACSVTDKDLADRNLRICCRASLTRPSTTCTISHAVRWPRSLSGPG